MENLTDKLTLDERRKAEIEIRRLCNKSLTDSFRLIESLLGNIGKYGANYSQTPSYHKTKIFKGKLTLKKPQVS